MTTARFYSTAHVLKRSIRLPANRERIFEFFSDAANLEPITPPSLNFQILTPLPIKMRDGAILDYTMRLNNFPFHWRTLISSWNPPYDFVDEQIKGPYLYWHHIHRFIEVDEATTDMVDEVHYKLRFEPVSRIILPWVQKQLTYIFNYRETKIRSLLLRHEIDTAP